MHIRQESLKLVAIFSSFVFFLSLVVLIIGGALVVGPGWMSRSLQETTCQIKSVQNNTTKECQCTETKNEETINKTCTSTYPCLTIQVGYYVTKTNDHVTSLILKEERDVFPCFLKPPTCAESSGTNNITVWELIRAYSRVGENLSCFYDPNNPDKVISHQKFTASEVGFALAVPLLFIFLSVLVFISTAKLFHQIRQRRNTRESIQAINTHYESFRNSPSSAFNAENPSISNIASSATGHAVFVEAEAKQQRDHISIFESQHKATHPANAEESKMKPNENLSTFEAQTETTGDPTITGVEQVAPENQPRILDEQPEPKRNSVEEPGFVSFHQQVFNVLETASYSEEQKGFESNVTDDRDVSHTQEFVNDPAVNTESEQKDSSS